MARVVPSQVVELIDKLFSFAKDQEDTQSKRVALTLPDANRLSAVVSMVDQIPSEINLLS